MGNYTGVRFTAKLHHEGLMIVQALIKQHEWPKLWKYASMPRRNFIPFGALCYMPSDWENENSLDESTWKVCCSLKDSGEVQEFLFEVLPDLIEESCNVEVYVELSGKHTVSHVLPPRPLCWGILPRAVRQRVAGE